MIDLRPIGDDRVPDLGDEVPEVLGPLVAADQQATEAAWTRLSRAFPGLDAGGHRADPVSAGTERGQLGVDPGYALPDTSVLDDLVGGETVGDGRLQLNRGGGVDLGPVIAQHRPRDGAPTTFNRARLAAAIVEGVTLQLSYADEVLNGLRSLCFDVERVYGGLAKADLFIAEKGAQGLGPHIDNAELLVAQIEGDKRWLVHPPEVQSPRRGFIDEERAVAEGRQGPGEDHRLVAGEWLYLPQGWWHEPTVAEGSSLSLSVAILRPEAASIAERLLRWGRHHRGDLRVPVGDEYPGAALAELGSVFAADDLGRWRRWARGTQPARPSTPFSTFHRLRRDGGGPGATARLCAPGGVVPVAADGNRVTTWVGGRQLVVDSSWITALAALNGGEWCRVADLHDGPEQGWPLVAALAGEELVDLRLD